MNWGSAARVCSPRACGMAKGTLSISLGELRVTGDLPQPCGCNWQEPGSPKVTLVLEFVLWLRLGLYSAVPKLQVIP